MVIDTAYDRERHKEKFRELLIKVKNVKIQLDEIEEIIKDLRMELIKA